MVNPRFLKPLDTTLICSWASRTGAVLTVEDGAVLGGFGSAVAQLLQEQEVYVPVKMLGFGDTFVDQGPQALLWHQAGLDAAGIASTAVAFLEKCRLR